MSPYFVMLDPWYKSMTFNRGACRPISVLLISLLMITLKLLSNLHSYILQVDYNIWGLVKTFVVKLSLGIEPAKEKEYSWKLYIRTTLKLLSNSNEQIKV